MKPIYHEYDDEFLNRKTLTSNDDFIDDATYFLIDRANYESKDLDSADKVYDAYLEHFRRQNVNEITAIKDLTYAQRANDENKNRMSRLMSTFDRIDEDFTVKGMTDAAIDYAEGVITAPSTVAGLFTFGSGKAASLAAQQGVKFGIKQALKGAGRSATGALAVDVPATVAQVGAQEQTRVELGQQEEINLANVGTSALISTLVTGTIGGASGVIKAKKQFNAEDMISTVVAREREADELGYEATKKAYKNKNIKEMAKNFENKLVATGKYALTETVPEEIKKGTAKLKSVTPDVEGASILPSPTLVRNIAAAGARVVNLLDPLEGVAKGSKEDLKERFSSKLSRALNSGLVPPDKIKRILEEHNVAPQQLASLMLEDAGDIMASSARTAGQTLRAFRTAKEADNITLELDAIDNALQNIGDFTTAGRRKLAEQTGFSLQKNIKSGISNLNKAGVGLMTIQLATTVRNTTNGYMRNFVYALDNLGAGLIDYAGGNVKKLISAPNSVLRKEAEQAVAYGKAQLRTGVDSFFLKDLVIGMDDVTTYAMYRLLKDDRFGASELSKRVFREMADVGDNLDARSGVLGLARKLNYFNTMSDNMFKRAIYARELDKSIRASTNGQETLQSFIKSGRFRKDLDISAHKNAMEQALEFTYQSDGFKAKPGWFNALADGFIKFGQSSGTFVAPFPRYMVNAFKFTYEHAPIIGMFDIPGAGLVTGTATERMSKQLTGMTMLGGFMAMRANLGNENTTPYEFKNPASGELVDTQALLGPFTAFAVLADVLYRFNFFNWHDNERVSKANPFTARELIQALGGGQGRGGSQLDIIDTLVNGLSSENLSDTDYDRRRTYTEVIPKILGDYFNRYFVGVGVLKDVVGQIDPEFAKVPDNTDINFWGYFFKRVTRSFPQTIGEDANGLFGYTGFGPTRTAKLESPTRTGGVEAFNPIIKQIYGVTELPRKTFIEKELDRLKIDYLELSPRRIKLDAPLSNEARGMMGKYMEEAVASYANSPTYKNLSESIKRQNLLKVIRHYRGLARDKFLNPELTNEMTDEQKLRRFETIFYNTGTKADRRVVFDAYRQKYGRELTEDAKTNVGAYIFGIRELEKKLKIQGDKVDQFK